VIVRIPAVFPGIVRNSAWMWWLGLAAATVVLGVLCLRRVLSHRSSSSDIDVGNVSENWLSGQRARTDEGFV
jgi:hypothetical protein